MEHTINHHLGKGLAIALFVSLSGWIAGCKSDDKSAKSSINPSAMVRVSRTTTTIFCKLSSYALQGRTPEVVYPHW